MPGEPVVADVTTSALTPSPQPTTQSAAPGVAVRREPQIPEIPLSQRLQRASRVAVDKERARLKQVTGTDDLETIAEKMKRLAELEAKDQEQRQATMTEIQRAQAERDAERQRREPPYL